MDKLINRILFISKIILLIIAFVVSLYISLIKMDTYELSILSIVPLFLPLLLVLIAFVFSFFLNIARENTLFNIVCILVLLAIIIIDYRTIFDKNIISNTIINLRFFDLEAGKIEIMLYLTFISNVLLIIYDKKIKMHS